MYAYTHAFDINLDSVVYCMYAQSLMATGKKAKDIHIRQITSAYVFYNQYVANTEGSLIEPEITLLCIFTGLV